MLLPQGFDKGIIIVTSSLYGHEHVFVEPRESRRAKAVLLCDQIRMRWNVNEGYARQRAVPRTNLLASRREPLSSLVGHPVGDVVLVGGRIVLVRGTAPRIKEPQNSYWAAWLFRTIK